MARKQAEKDFPEYALAYLRYLAGERGTVPVPTGSEGKSQYGGIDRHGMARVQSRIQTLVEAADLSRHQPAAMPGLASEDGDGPPPPADGSGTPRSARGGSVADAAMRRLQAAERERRAAVQQLINHGVVRSHVLVGDLGERIAAAFYGVDLAPAFTPGYDLIDGQGRRVQVKTLRATPDKPRSIVGEIKRPCDVVFALRLDFDYSPTEALEIPAQVAECFVGANGKVSWTRKLAAHPAVSHFTAEQLRV
jgi:hypothetical protein